MCHGRSGCCLCTSDILDILGFCGRCSMAYPVPGVSDVGPDTGDTTETVLASE